MKTVSANTQSKKGRQWVVLLVMLSLGIIGCDSVENERSSLVAYWSFDDGEVIDNSGSGHDGTVYGANSTTGVLGNAMEFDGIDDYLEIPHTKEFNTSQKSVLFWFFKNNDTIEQTMARGNYVEGLVFKSFDTARDRALSFSLLNHEAPFDLVFHTGDGSADLLKVGADVPILPRQWYHVAVVMDNSAISLYVNGVLANRSAFTGTIVHNTAPIIVGKASVNSHTQRFFDGKIDELRIYDSALPQSEIQAVFEERD